MADSIFDVIFGSNRFEPKRDFDIFGYKDEYMPTEGTASVPFYEQERQFKTLPKAQPLEQDPFRFNYEQPVGADILTRAGNVSLPMTVEGIKQSFTGGLDALMDLGGSIPTTAKEKPLEDVGVMDFNVYNAYKDKDPGQGFTDAFREAGILSLPTDVQEKMREYSPASDLFKYGANIASGGLFTKAITGKVFSDAINFGLPGLTFDLNDPNFGQIFQELGADNEVVDWLAGDGKNEDAQARIEQRLKNTLTETGLSYLVDQGIRVIRNAKDLIKNPEYRKQVIEDTASGLVDTRSPIDKVNESLYNIKAIQSGNKNLVQTDPRFGSQIFAGEKAEGADKDMLAIAKARYKSENLNNFDSPRAFQGREEVWSETGWAQDRNGKWYFEIDDSELEIPDYVLNNIKSDKPYAIGLSGGIKHDKLFKQYPELEDYTIEFVPGERIANSNQIAIKGSTAQASANFKKKTIYIPKLDNGTLAPDVKESIVHELQHMVQEKERFMNGGDGSLGYAMTIRDQLTKEAIDKAQDPGLFKTMMNFRRLVDYNQQQPVFAEILNLLRRDKVEDALTKLKGTSWWATEGDVFTYKLQQKLKDKGIDKDYYKNNPNALKTELLGGTVDLEKIVKTYNEDINNIYQSFQNTYKTNDPVGDVRNYIQGTLEKVGGNVALLKKVLSDRAGKAFGGDNDYFLNKLRMIDDVENGVYKDSVARKQVYNQLTGESQSRNVERRINMNEEQRRMNFPEYSEEFGRVTKQGQFGTVTSDMPPIYVDRPGQFTKRKWEESQGVLQLADDQPMSLEPINTDDAGFFLRSENILNNTEKDLWVNPDEIFKEGKKGKSGLLKDVPKQELEESGLLNYLDKAKESGDPVTKRGLLEQIRQGKPRLEISSGMSGMGDSNRQVYMFRDNMINDGVEASGREVVDFEDSTSYGRVDDLSYDLEHDIEYALNDYSDEHKLLKNTPSGKAFLKIQDDIKTASEFGNKLTAEEESIVEEYAYDLMRHRYENEPEYMWELQSGDYPTIKVYGNDSDGYYAWEEGNGSYMDRISIAEYDSLAETQVKIEQHLNDSLGFEDSGETFWSSYTAPGQFDDSTYKEMNIEIDQKGLGYPTHVQPHDLPGDTDRSLFFTRSTERELRLDDGEYANALHIDEIQSDWHQQARKFGIEPEEAMKKGRNAVEAIQQMRVKVSELVQQQADEFNKLQDFKMTFIEDIIDQDPFLRKHKDIIENTIMSDFGRAGTTVKTYLEDISPSIGTGYINPNKSPSLLQYPKYQKNMSGDVMKALDKKILKMHKKAKAPEQAVIKEKEKANAVLAKLERFVEDAPGRTNSFDDTGKQFTGVGGTEPPLGKEKWEETALKTNIMDAIERDIDYVTWTPSEIQEEIWSDEYRELYRNIYDKRAVKNAKKLVKEYGGELKKGVTDYGWNMGEKEVYYIKITPEMKNKIKQEGGMPLYSFAPVGTAPMFQPPIGLLSTSQTSENDGRIDENKGLLQ